MKVIIVKNYLISENVKEKILEGINEASAMISKTFGPQGKNVIIDDYGLYLSVMAIQFVIVYALKIH